jgi:hypothetical protein
MILICVVANPGCLSWIPDPTFFHPRSRIRIVSIPDPGSASKNLSRYFNPKLVSKVHPGSRISDPDPDFLSIPDPGSRGQKGTGSRIRNTAYMIFGLLVLVHNFTHPNSAGLLDPEPDTVASKILKYDNLKDKKFQGGWVPTKN